MKHQLRQFLKKMNTRPQCVNRQCHILWTRQEHDEGFLINEHRDSPVYFVILKGVICLQSYLPDAPEAELNRIQTRLLRCRILENIVTNIITVTTRIPDSLALYVLVMWYGLLPCQEISGISFTIFTIGCIWSSRKRVGAFLCINIISTKKYVYF